MPLNRDYDRMKAVGYSQEALDALERAMALNLSPERQAEIRREEEERQRLAIRAEQERLRALADAAEAGRYGPEGKEVARLVLAGGRTDKNLRELRDAIRRLR